MELLEGLTDLAGIFVLQFVTVGSPVTVSRLAETAYLLSGVLSAEGSGGSAVTVVSTIMVAWLLLVFLLLRWDHTKILRDISQI